MAITITANMLGAAGDVLRQLLAFTYPADSVVSQYFREHRELGQRERAFIAESVYAVLRRKRLLERLCGPKAKSRQLLLAALVRVQGVSQRQLA